jgi:2-desacetyl-2-hydroxyethyl bacteriochlorophyllide A dehydrogenase
VVRGTRVVFAAPERVELESFDIPAVGPYQVLVRSEVTKTSAGTEMTTLLGIRPGQRYPAHPGYSNVGTVLEAGNQVAGLQPGDRIISTGGHASHCLLDLSPARPGGPQYTQLLPQDVAAQDAVFTFLGAVALHGVRRAEPAIRQSAAVLGLGVVGQLLAQLVRLGGARPVIGIDRFALRLEKAKESGASVVFNAAREDALAAVRAAAGGAGVDIGFDATRDPAAIRMLLDIAAPQGKVIVVGSNPGTVELSFYNPFQIKELTIIAARQPSTPESGDHYYPWTTARNRLAFLELLGAGDVRVAHLVTHRVVPAAAPRLYDTMQQAGGTWLGLLLDWTMGT